MFNTIMIPVDLAHADRLEKALGVACDLAGHYGAEVHLVGVTQTAPTAVAKSPDDYSRKLDAFASEKSAALGTRLTAHSEISHDPSIDLDDVLEKTAEKIGADLIVMASHVPGFAERIFASNAGYLASHAKMSVLVLR